MGGLRNRLQLNYINVQPFIKREWWYIKNIFPLLRNYNSGKIILWSRWSVRATVKKRVKVRALKWNKSKWWLWGMISQLYHHRFLWISQSERMVNLRDLSFPSFWLRREPLGEVVEPRPQLFSKAEWLESATIGDAIVASGQGVTRASLERHQLTRWLLQMILLWGKKKVALFVMMYWNKSVKGELLDFEIHIIELLGWDNFVNFVKTGPTFNRVSSPASYIFSQ